MSENFYQIILTGDSEYDEPQTAATLAKIFDKTETQMQRLLAMTPIVIRKSVDQEMAEKYQTVLIEQGLGIKLQPIEEPLEINDAETESLQIGTDGSLESVSSVSPGEDIALDKAPDDQSQHLSWSLEPTENEAKPISGRASYIIDEEGIDPSDSE